MQPMIYVLQGDYGHGWEDLTASESRADMTRERRTYREEECGEYRIIYRRQIEGE